MTVFIVVPLYEFMNPLPCYPYKAMMTPYEKLKSVPDAERYLKPGTTFEQLDEIALSISDNEAVKQMNEAKRELFKSIFEQKQSVA